MSTGKEIVKSPSQVALTTLRDQLSRMKSSIEQALPSRMDPDRMIRVALTAIQSGSGLIDCSARSVVKAVMEASQLGLEPDGILGSGYLVPFRMKSGERVCTFIAGYRGLMTLARRSGNVKTFDIGVVYKGDEFVWRKGTEPKLLHTPKATVKKDSLITHVYAIAFMKDGGYQVECMEKADVDAVRARSKSANDGPWVTDYPEMAKKTAIRRLCKYLELNPEDQRAVSKAEMFDMGVEIEDPELVVPPSITGEGKTALDALSDKLSKESAVVDAETVPQEEEKPKRTRKAKPAPEPEPEPEPEDDDFEDEEEEEEEETEEEEEEEEDFEDDDDFEEEEKPAPKKKSRK